LLWGDFFFNKSISFYEGVSVHEPSIKLFNLESIARKYVQAIGTHRYSGGFFFEAMIEIARFKRLKGSYLESLCGEEFTLISFYCIKITSLFNLINQQLFTTIDFDFVKNEFFSSFISNISTPLMIKLHEVLSLDLFKSIKWSFYTCFVERAMDRLYFFQQNVEVFYYFFSQPVNFLCNISLMYKITYIFLIWGVFSFYKYLLQDYLNNRFFIKGLTFSVIFIYLFFFSFLFDSTY